MKLLIVLTVLVCYTEAVKIRKSDFPKEPPFETTPEEDEIFSMIGYRKKSGSFKHKDKTFEFHHIEFMEGTRKAYLTTVKSGEFNGVYKDYSLKRAYIQAYRNCVSKMEN